MREIKFRAYDKKIRKFSNFIINCKNSIEFMDDNTCGWYGENHERYKDFELMQYTGVKDKNGKEIYEWDILLDSHTEEYCNVVFEDGCYIAEFQTNTIELNEVVKDLEVVGNIYENPELIGDDE